MTELLIQNEKELFAPAVVDPIRLTRERRGYPSKLEFSVPKEATLGFSEGNPVRLKVDEDRTFLGYVWSKSRNKDGLIRIVAYDQLKYFTYKDTLVYQKKKASEVIRMLAADQNLKVGDLTDTKYIIAKRIQDNKTFFDIIYDALDLTLENTGKLFVLYDNFGRLELKELDEMKLDILLSADVACDYDYQSTLDNTFNQIKLIKENKESGKREVYIARDSGNIKKWGKLQYFDTIDEKTSGQNKANALLQLYNKPNRTLKFQGVLGDVRVRGGSLIYTDFNLGDTILKHYMMVERVTHLFSDNEHRMDLEIRGKI